MAPPAAPRPEHSMQATAGATDPQVGRLPADTAQRGADRAERFGGGEIVGSAMQPVPEQLASLFQRPPASLCHRQELPRSVRGRSRRQVERPLGDLGARSSKNCRTHEIQLPWLIEAPCSLTAMQNAMVALGEIPPRVIVQLWIEFPPASSSPAHQAREAVPGAAWEDGLDRRDQAVPTSPPLPRQSATDRTGIGSDLAWPSCWTPEGLASPTRLGQVGGGEMDSLPRGADDHRSSFGRGDPDANTVGTFQGVERGHHARDQRHRDAAWVVHHDLVSNPQCVPFEPAHHCPPDETGLATKLLWIYNTSNIFLVSARLTGATTVPSSVVRTLDPDGLRSAGGVITSSPSPSHIASRTQASPGDLGEPAS